jgi:Ran GTPase-activating protein (RanGAP) involved in mRNA processing and transport
MSRKQVAELAEKKELTCEHSTRAGITYTANDWDVLAEVLRTTTTLQKLAFRGQDTRIALQNDKVVAALAKNRSIKEIELCWNVIDHEGAAWLKDTLKSKSKSLTKIGFGHNQISAEGAAALADVLKDNKSLTKIKLANSQIGDEGARALAAALKVNSSLQELHLYGNNISDLGAAAMANALIKNITLKKLWLSSNKIGEKGGKAILNALQQSGNSSIEYIALYWNDVTKETLNKIREEIKRIQKSIKTVADDEGQVPAEEDLEGETHGDDNDRSSDATGQPTTIDAGNVYPGDANDEDAQITAERHEDIEAKETVTDTKEQELQSTITRLQRELVAKDEVISEKDEEIASMKAILKKIGVIANGKDNDFNSEGGEAPQSMRRETESGDRNYFLSQREKELQSEIDSLREQLNNHEMANDNNEEEEFNQDGEEVDPPAPAKRRRTSTNSGRSEQDQTNSRATRSRVRKVQVKQENIKAGAIKCPDSQCGNIILHDGGCKRLACTNHCRLLFFCAHCKMIGEEGSEIIRCDCPNRNTQADRDLAQEMRNQRSRDNPEVVE